MQTLQRAAALAALSLAFAAPAYAHPEPAGSSHNWVQQQPTHALGTEAAQVLVDDLAYLDIGAGAGFTGFGGLGLGYNRGMGNGGEFSAAVSAVANTAPGTFAGGLSAGWKQQLLRGHGMAVALDGRLGVLGLGGTVGLALGVGLPLTFDAGPGHLTAEPRITFPALTTGTTNASAEVGIGYEWPVLPRWTLLGDIAPTFAFAGGFTAPIGLGARFSPTATSHVDFTVGNINPSPFAAQIGLVGVTGYVGF